MSTDEDMAIQFEKDYRSLVPLAESICIELESQLGMLMSEAGISLGFPIQWRVKSWPSISEKCQRTALPIKSLAELQDLAGLRLILLFKKDIESVLSIIESKFNVVRQYDTADRLKEDQFGYVSYHMVVTLPDAWTNVPTMAKLKGIQAEVQIRTVAQHIWAEASRLLQYKREQSVPPPVRRSIYRVSALLETVDLEIDRLVTQKSEYRGSIDLANREAKLNADSLEVLLDRLLPAANKKTTEDYGNLLQELNAFGITTVHQLEDLWSRHKERALAVEKTRLQEELKKMKSGQTPTGTSIERLQEGVYFLHVGLIRIALRNAFGEKYDNFLGAKRTKQLSTTQ
jgi:putative GTP pyrophosphokinase